MFLLYFAAHLFNLAHIFGFGLKKSEKMGIKYLSELELKFNGRFEEKIFKKVVKLNSILQNFVCNSFSLLHDRVNNEVELQRNLLYFLTTALYDDIIDGQKMSTSALDAMFYNPESARPINFEESVLVYIHLQLINQVPDKRAYWDVIDKIHIAQKDSIQQFRMDHRF